MMSLAETRLAVSQPGAVGPSVGPDIMTPERKSAQVIDFASERARLMDARRKRGQRALIEDIRKLCLQDRYRALDCSRARPPDDPEPYPGGDAA